MVGHDYRPDRLRSGTTTSNNTNPTDGGHNYEHDRLHTHTTTPAAYPHNHEQQHQLHRRSSPNHACWLFS